MLNEQLLFVLAKSTSANPENSGGYHPALGADRIVEGALTVIYSEKCNSAFQQFFISKDWSAAVRIIVTLIDFI